VLPGQLLLVEATGKEHRSTNKRKSEESRYYHRAAHCLNSMREQCTPPRSRLFARIPEVSFKFVLDAFFLPSTQVIFARRRRRAESTQAHRTSMVHAVGVRPHERNACGTHAGGRKLCASGHY
jgi:hypothetical protein